MHHRTMPDSDFILALIISDIAIVSILGTGLLLGFRKLGRRLDALEANIGAALDRLAKRGSGDSAQDECRSPDERAFVSESRAHDAGATRVLMRGAGGESRLHEVDVVGRHP